MKKDSKPHQIGLSFASGLGVLGFVLSLVSLGWQVHVHQESLTEKALVRFSISFLNSDQEIRSFNKSAKNRFSVVMDPAVLKKSELTAEVVNIGQHTLYVKSVRLIVPCPETGDSDSVTFQPTKGSYADGLEPGAASTYKASSSWDFVRHPLVYGPEPFCVTVESNKGFLTQTDQLSYVTFTLGKEGKSKLDQTPVSVPSKTP